MGRDIRDIRANYEIHIEDVGGMRPYHVTIKRKGSDKIIYDRYTDTDNEKVIDNMVAVCDQLGL